MYKKALTLHKKYFMKLQYFHKRKEIKNVRIFIFVYIHKYMSVSISFKIL